MRFSIILASVAIGPDLLFGGDGNDHLNVKDGIGGNDRAYGGPGDDTCLADPGDLKVSC